MTAEIDLLALLELSPGPPPPEKAALVARLGEKRREWARKLSQGGQKAKREAQKMLELLPELERILADPGRLRETLRLAQAREEAAAGALRQELEATIVLLKRSSGSCGPEQLESLIQRFEKIGRPAIERSLRAAGVSLERPRARRESRPEPIDATLAQAIAIQLNHLGRQDLYDFLGLPAQSAFGALQDQARKIYRENQRLGRSDAASSAANRLAGLCVDRVFVDGSAKQRYDAHLARTAMEPLRKDLDFAGLGRSLSPSAIDHFVEIARQRGVASDVARDFIEDYAEERGWQIFDPVAVRKEAQAARKKQDDQLAELARLVAETRLQAADQLLQRLRRDGLGGLDETAARIGEGLSRARQSFERGLSAREAGKSEAAERCFEQAEAFCCDLPPLLAFFAAIGRPARQRRIPPLSHLKWQRSGSVILLTWEWPPGIEAARVRVGYDRHPESAEEPGPAFDVTLGEYRREGAFVLRQPAARKHFFAVFAGAAGSGFSVPVRAFAGLGQEIMVRYRVVVERSLFGRRITAAELELESEEEALDLPALVVVGKPAVVPISPRDGRILLELAAARLERGRTRVAIPAEAWGSGCYLKVFFRNSAAGEGIRLLPGAKEELFLG